MHFYYLLLRSKGRVNQCLYTNNEKVNLCVLIVNYNNVSHMLYLGRGGYDDIKNRNVYV